MSEKRRQQCERWRQLTEASASMIGQMMAMGRAKTVENRCFTPDEMARIDWLNTESNRLLMERDALDRAMQSEMRSASVDSSDVADKLAKLRALPYAPVPATVRQKQVELMRKPIRDPHVALQILERKKLDDDAYVRLLRESAARRYDGRRQDSWVSSRPGVNWRPQVRDYARRQRVPAPWMSPSARKTRDNT